MKEQFAAAGLISTRFYSAEARALDGKYLLAKVAWQISVRRAGGVIKTIDAFATYVLEQGQDKQLSIVFQLDHQDLATLIRPDPQSRSA
jgi:hypothetical protein